jgi:hypothetical protein
MSVESILKFYGAVFVIWLLTFPSPSQAKSELLVVYLIRIGVGKNKQLINYLGRVL